MKKFDWEDFAEGKIVVKFSSKEEIKDFCENAFIREFKFYNKRTKIEDVIDDLLNLSCTDGYVNDLKICIIDSKYSGFRTQSTIRVDSGGTISNLIEQLAT